MRIQLLCYKDKQSFDYEKPAEMHPFSQAGAFDAFDVTVVDSQSKDIWKNKGSSYTRIDSANNLASISTPIQQSRRCKTLVLLPQNETFLYSWSMPMGRPPYQYMNKIALKDMLFDLTNKILPDFFQSKLSLLFGHSSTMLGSLELKSDFSPTSTATTDLKETQTTALTLSEANISTTSLLSERFCLTTLAIKTYDQLIALLKKNRFHLRRKGS